jgi:hypothetical protein
MGRPRAKIDPAQVAALAGIGCPPNEIAAELSCGEMTIHRRFGTVVKKGHDKCRTRIRSKLFRKAMAGDNACLIFLAKAFCGLKEHDPLTNISVTASASANPYRTPSIAEFKQRMLDAGEFLKKHNFGLEDPPPPNRLDNGA